MRRFAFAIAAVLFAVPVAAQTAPERPVPQGLGPDAPLPPQDNIAACEAPSTGGIATAAPLHVQVTDEFGPYRAANVVTLTDRNGLPLATLNCDGPWANFHVTPGSYRVVASVNQMRSPDVTIEVPRTGASVTVQLPPEPDRANEVP